jgi:hypothetical protein
LAGYTEVRPKSASIHRPHTPQRVSLDGPVERLEEQLADADLGKVNRIAAARWAKGDPMKIRSTAMLLLLLINGMGGCGGSGSTPPMSPTPMPPPPPPPGPVQLAVFTDPVSGFMTSDVRDVQRQIVRFDVASNSLIWVGDGRSFSGYPASGLFIGADRSFQVRFGTEDGERRAYFTETATETICDIEIVGGQLAITGTNVKVPGS